MKWPVTSMLFCNLMPCDDCTLYDERPVLLAKQTIHFVNTNNVVLVGLGIGAFELDIEDMLDSELDIEDMFILVWMPLVSDLQKLASTSFFLSLVSKQLEELRWVRSFNCETLESS